MGVEDLNLPPATAGAAPPDTRAERGRSGPKRTGRTGGSSSQPPVANAGAFGGSRERPPGGAAGRAGGAAGAGARAGSPLGLRLLALGAALTSRLCIKFRSLLSLSRPRGRTRSCGAEPALAPEPWVTAPRSVSGARGTRGVDRKDSVALNCSRAPLPPARRDREPDKVTRAATSTQMVLPLLWPTWALCVLLSPTPPIVAAAGVTGAAQRRPPRLLSARSRPWPWPVQARGGGKEGEGAPGPPLCGYPKERSVSAPGRAAGAASAPPGLLLASTGLAQAAGGRAGHGGVRKYERKRKVGFFVRNHLSKAQKNSFL